MASLQLITKGWQTGYRLRVCTGGKRHSVWLGPVRDREALAIKRHVEAVVDSQQMRTPLPTETQRWLTQISAELRVRLREVLGVAKTVDEAVENYLQWYADQNKAGTVRASTDTLEQFASHFGSQQMRSLTGEEIDHWLAQLNVAGPTVGKHAKNLRSWLKWCKTANYCDAELVIATPSTIGVGEKEFIDLAEYQRVIDSFDDVEMRAVLAISRWSGVRVASEVVGLRRSSIDLENNRFLIYDSKRTRRRSRDPPVVRTTPLFSGLLPYLEALLRLPGKPHDFLLPTLGGMDQERAGSLLRQRVYRRQDKLGIQRWPKVFHSPRATRQTELIGLVGEKAACDWIGNSREVSRRNYELILDETFDRAVGEE